MPRQNDRVLRPGELRKAFAAFPSGVTAVCGLTDAGPTGMAASSFTSVSLQPPLVSVCIARTSSTWPRLRSARRLGVSVLAAHQETVARQLAGPAEERFADLPCTDTADGARFIDGACLWLDCVVADELSAGDHVIALLGLESVETFPEREPLVFHGSGYRSLVL